MRKTLIASIFILLASILAPALATAQGNSAGDQYDENVPNPGGEGNGGGGSGNGGGGNSGDGGSGNSLPPGVADDLAEQGDDGVAAAGLAAQGPDSDGTGDNDGDGSTGGKDSEDSESGTASASPSDSSGSSGSPVGEIAQAATGTDGDGGGTGLLLPIVIGVALLGGVAYLIISRRGGSGTPDPA